jgi:RNA polymerase sigma-70 factor (ECF subfamily)
MTDESQLIGALRRQDRQAFSQLFETYSDKLFRLAAGLLHDEDEAEGVVQDTFLRLFEKLDRFEGRSRLGTWLYRVAYNASIDRLRQRRVTQPLADEASATEALSFIPSIFTDWTLAPETLFASAEAQTELDRCIAQLPESLRVTFILREIEGLSTTETAEVLNLKQSAVKVRLHRARLSLREALSSYFGELVAKVEEN